MVGIDLGFIASSVGFGGIAGFLIGYAVKKVVKITLILVGLFFAALAYLNYQGIVLINWDRLASHTANVTTGIGNATGQVTGVQDQLTTALLNFGIPFTGSFTAAFIFGFMKG